MIGDYIVVAFVFAIGLSFLGIIHYFWLRDAFREETPPLDGLVENQEKCEIYSVLNESSSKAGCQTSQFAIQASPRSERNNREIFDPGATTLVGRKGTVPMGRMQHDLSAQAKTALSELGRQEFPESVRVSVEVRKGVPYDQIAVAARDLNADIIIIATHGQTGLKHALLGSNAERVVRHAPCPVLTLRRAPGHR